MNERLLQFIEYKTNGKQADFALLVGWIPQYVSKLIKGENFGIRPVITLLKTFPELNARWLLTGEGEMLSFNPATSVIKDRLQRLLELEKYMKVMTPAELHQITECENLDFPKETFDKWEKLLEERDKEWEERKLEAMNKQKELCKMKIAKK
jgi:hypothetical protein